MVARRLSTCADRLVVTTLVSSALLGKMASAHGVAFQETFTGFKWMAHAALQNPDKRLVFAYEQAIGFLVASRPLDKDGVSAAVVLVELVASLAAAGSTVEARLEEIAGQYGRHVTAEISDGPRCRLGGGGAAAQGPAQRGRGHESRRRARFPRSKPAAAVARRGGRCRRARADPAERHGAEGEDLRGGRGRGPEGRPRGRRGAAEAVTASRPPAGARAGGRRRPRGAGSGAAPPLPSPRAPFRGTRLSISSRLPSLVFAAGFQ
ncbi:unnamed protein product [Prorocentrum cordatum]|uniref:Alpha-D-phosphohexomutase alpha/beta/alpha domain-containing protein n=1 Tax=Prorocentrum cordatum TaxID=2364126 RepID=A0ABN9UVU1_9DINO|nr:unnamed protein product [Polarella glacialis]